MQPSASLLAGDALQTEIRLGPGARLDLLEVAATVAHPSRGGPRVSLQTNVHIGADAILAWDAKPLVLCEGCDVLRLITIELDAGAVMVMRDTLVFGRAGEQPGAFATRTVATYDGAPLHHEALDTSDVDTFRSASVMGQARVLDAVAIYGARREGTGVLQLAGPGSLRMIPAADAADAARVADAAFRSWRPSAAAG